jgi:hypothetical protein
VPAPAAPGPKVLDDSLDMIQRARLSLQQTNQTDDFWQHEGEWRSPVRRILSNITSCI